MLSVAEPLFVIVMACRALPPTEMAPNTRLVGRTSIRDCDCAPFPLRAILAGVLESLIASETLPLALPAAFGAKATLKVLDCPAARFIGALKPLREKSLPETVACETTTPTLAEFVTVTFWALLEPTVTFPKFTLDGFSVSGVASALGEVEPLVPTRAQPFKPTMLATASNRTRVYRTVAVFLGAGLNARRACESLDSRISIIRKQSAARSAR